MAEEIVLVVPLAFLLLAAWALATRDEAQRQRARSAEWDTAAGADLWTSAATCPTCHSPGGVLEPDVRRFTCLACGAQHDRETKG